MFGRPNPRKLRDQAQAAVAKGKHQKALEAYLELERVEPKSGDWSRRAGEQYRALDHTSDAVAAWTRAIDRYAAAGFMVKAVAVCKMILRLEPDHTDAQRRLVRLNEARGIRVVNDDIETTEVPLEVAVAAAAEPPPPEQKRRTLPPNAALADISLKDTVAGSSPIDLGTADESDSKAYEIPIEIDLDDVEELVDEDDASEALASTPLFSELPGPSLHALIHKLRLVELAPGEVLFREGDPGRELFVVAEGEVAVVDEGPPRIHLTTLGEGTFFGEVSLVTSQTRNATIEAKEPTQLLGIDRDSFGELVDQEPAVLGVLLRFLRDRLVDNLVRSSPLFAPFGEGERAALAKKFRFLEVEPNMVMVAQGKRSNGLYVVLAGGVEVIREDEAGKRRLATLAPGDLAGEMSLLANTEAIATVRATTKVLALELPSAVFRELIMTHPQVLTYVSEVADERKRQFEAIVNGSADYQATHLGLV